MFRSRPDTFRYISDPAVANSGINAGDFRFGGQSGYEIGFIAHNATHKGDLEFRYMNVDGWSDGQSAAIAGNPFRINTNPPTFVSGPRDVFANYKSSLHSFEVNQRATVRDSKSCSRTDFIAGFRHLRIDESLSNRLVSTATPPIATEHFNVSTSNDLFGLQLGFNSVVNGDCNFCLEGYGKAGLYANRSNQRVALANEVTTPPTVFRNSDSDTDVAVAIETGLNLTYRLNDCASTYIGYHAMWVDGVALASNQVAQTGFGLNGGNVAPDDDVLYHGFRFGLEFAF